MSLKEIEDSLKTFGDIEEAPRLRARIKQLETELETREREHSISNKQHSQSILQLRRRCTRLESIRLLYPHGELGLENYHRRILSEARKVNENSISELAYVRAEELLDYRVAVEIQRYPRCKTSTKKLIEKVADTRLGERFFRLIWG